MKKFILIVSLLTVYNGTIFGQDTNYLFKDSLLSDLDFETIENGLPVNWYGINDGDTLNYTVSLDSTVVKSGKYSVAITCTGVPSDHKAIVFTLPSYEGKKITLSGYIKTEGITEGYAGLIMAINHLNGSDLIAHDDGMRITGTTDWKKYAITLDMNPANTGMIALFGVLSGNGKMWLDDLEVTIDGKDIQQLKPYIKKPYPAEKDKEFDNGSGIVFPELSKRHIRDLNLLGRVWGFLKYHHPAIAKGNYNWDYELFRFLPVYLEGNTTAQREILLLNWIDKLGEVPVCEDCLPTSGSAFLKPDLSWVENSDLSPIVKDRLHYIYQNRYQGHHYHVMIGYWGNPLFLNENEYAGMPYPDAGFRLLALYRYWSAVNYFFPYKYLTDKDWNDVLGGYIPLFVNAKDGLEYELAAIRLIGEICDSHAAHLLKGGDRLNASRGYWMAPFQTRFIENKLVVADYYTLRDTLLTDDELKREIEIQVGDIITHINGKPVDAIADSLRPYYPASNEATRMKDMAIDLLRSNRKAMRVDYITSGQRKQKDINLFSFRYLNVYDWSVVFHKMAGVEEDIGYIKLATLREEDVPVIQREFKETKGLILDLRSRPTLAGRLLGSWFVSAETPFEKRMKGNPNNPGEFSFFRQNTVYPSKETYTGKVVVLINEETLSEGESQALMFRAGQNTILIGSQTSGADGTVAPVSLPGGIRTWISGVGVYDLDGQEVQRIGIVPDIEVKPTIDGIREGRDELIEKALELIGNK
jgi:C-terminal processing protease CtpA/Prc